MTFVKGLSLCAAALGFTLALGCGRAKSTPSEAPTVGGGVADDVNVESILPRNGSDPAAMVGGDGWLYLYTSSDLYNNDPNLFPMEATYVYAVGPGGNPGDATQWWDGGAVLTEANLTGTPWNWGSGRPRHLWAPEAIHFPRYNGYWLYVPDVESSDPQRGPFSNSWISVFWSANPWGPFEDLSGDGHYGFVGMSVRGGRINLSSYASDPSPAYDPNTGNQYLVFANGYGQNCGGLSLASLSWSDPTSFDSVAAIHVNGISKLERTGYDTDLVCDPTHDPNHTPLSTALSPNCSIDEPKATRNTDHGWVPRCTSENSLSGEYLEGASLYYLDQSSGVNPTRGPWYLVFPRKPMGKNQVISYATADSLAVASDGHVDFQYRGDILGSSTTSWTNQASIVRWNNQWLLFYHDAAGSTDRNRKVHMECMYFNDDGTIVPVTRSSKTSPKFRTCARDPQPLTVNFALPGSSPPSGFQPKVSLGGAECLGRAAGCTQYFASGSTVLITWSTNNTDNKERCYLSGATAAECVYGGGSCSGQTCTSYCGRQIGPNMPALTYECSW